MKAKGWIEMSTNESKGRVLRTGTVLGSLAVVAIVSMAWLGTRPEPSKTLQNLQVAYNGESNAHTRYLAFADGAEHEEYFDVASLFRAAAYAEHVHLERFAALIRKMGAEPASSIETPVVKTTAENLRTSADYGETYERDTLYPAFIAEAEAEGNQDAAQIFKYVRTAEAQHVKLFKAALANLKTTGVESHPYHVCKMCGFTAEHPIKPCPGCSDPHAVYVEIH
jgi:rubrerythrin